MFPLQPPPPLAGEKLISVLIYPRIKEDELSGWAAAARIAGETVTTSTETSEETTSPARFLSETFDISSTYNNKKGTYYGYYVQNCIQWKNLTTSKPTIVEEGLWHDKVVISNLDLAEAGTIYVVLVRNERKLTIGTA